MKETVAREYVTTEVAAPRAAADMAAFAARVTARSQIVWGEHCSECDYPKCYATCAFYDPRPDLNCRRFVAGIEAAGVQAGVRLSRIRFRRWGKLEGRGPARLRPTALALRREAADATVSAALAGLPTPFTLRRNLAWRWNTLKAGQPRGRDASADAFVVEGWTLDGATRGFTLTFLQDGADRKIWQTSFELGTDYARISVPAVLIAAAVDLAAPYLVQIEPVGEAAGVDVVFGLTDFVALAPSAQAPSAATTAPLAKVVVWDLDETLWRGVLAEDGIAGLTVRPEAVAAIKALDARGVLHSIASKNNHDEAMAALRQFGLADYFLHPQISWGPKSEAIGAIAAALDLGVDSFVFIDDQPFERAETTASHPSLRVLPETAAGELVINPWFDHPVTPESAGRRGLYQAEAKRTAEFKAASGDYLGFLRTSGLRLDITPLGKADAERAFELSQRTNQLNFTGAKFSREAVDAMLTPSAGRARLVLRCADRFGDYGMIGLADLDLDAGELTDFFMSCRVQRKRVENAFFAHAASLLGAAGHAEFKVRFRATARNRAAVEMLTELGFSQGEAGADGYSHWRRSLAEPFGDADVVRIAALAEVA
jgi:FkbH-like protein